MIRIERSSITPARVVEALVHGHRVESGVTHWGREVSYQVALEAKQPGWGKVAAEQPETAIPGEYVVRFWERDATTSSTPRAVPIKAQGRILARASAIEAVTTFLQLAGPFIQIIDPEESEAAE